MTICVCVCVVCFNDVGSCVCFRFHYVLGVMSMEVNGAKLSVDPSDFETTVVDSGTTLAYFPEKVYDVFLDAVGFITIVFVIGPHE